LKDNSLVESKGKRRRHYWLDSVIVRREACKLAIQHRYFSPEWFAEFKDCLHCGSHPYYASMLEELCKLLGGTEACKYCVKKSTDHCVLDTAD